jgi:hypothetical protein
LKAILGVYAVYAALADGQASLAQLLGYDCAGCVWVEESVAYGLADGLVGPSIVGFGACGLVKQCEQSALAQGFSQLEVSLSAEAELARRGCGSGVRAFALDEHGELAARVVVGAQSEGAARADEGVAAGVEVEHGEPLCRGCAGGGEGTAASVRGRWVWRVTERGVNVN